MTHTQQILKDLDTAELVAMRARFQAVADRKDSDRARSVVAAIDTELATR